MNYKNNSSIIKADTYEGAILNIKESKNWIPDKKIIAEFEKKLIPYVNNFKFPKSTLFNSKRTALSFVKNKIKKYKRQYIGIFIKKNKILYCNFLIINKSDKEMQNNWKNKLICVMDGGACYFQIKYDIKSKKLFDFFINGDA